MEMDSSFPGTGPELPRNRLKLIQRLSSPRMSSTPTLTLVHTGVLNPSTWTSSIALERRRSLNRLLRIHGCQEDKVMTSPSVWAPYDMAANNNS